MSLGLPLSDGWGGAVWMGRRRGGGRGKLGNSGGLQMLFIGTASAPAASNELLSPRIMVCSQLFRLMLAGFNSLSAPILVRFFSDFTQILQMFRIFASTFTNVYLLLNP